jgi:hypothetical protein
MFSVLSPSPSHVLHHFCRTSAPHLLLFWSCC